MILPIGDDNPTARQPVVNWTLIGLNALIFLATIGDDLGPTPWVLEHLALRPDAVEPWQPLTSMFLHGGVLHLAGNMLYLWICGDNVEDTLGRAWYVLFFVACGVAADLAHLAIHYGSPLPTIGASGAVSGVLGAYVVLFPNHQIKLFYWFYWWIGVWYVSAKWAIGFWFAQNLLLAVFFEQRGVGGVATMAHVGGFLAGAAVAWAWRDRLLAGRPAPKPRLSRGGPVVRGVEFGPVPDGLDAAGRPIYDARVHVRAAPVTATWAPGTGSGWAVLATSEEPVDVPAAAAVVATASGRPVADVLPAVAAGGGFWVRDVDEATARAVVRALSRERIGAVARREADLRPLPPLVEVPRALFHADGFEADTAEGFLRVSYREPALLVAARVQRASGAGAWAEVLTVFLREGPRLLFVEGDTVAKLARPGWGVAVGMPLRAIAVRLLNHGPQADRNRGVQVLTGAVRLADWTDLSFPGFRAYEAYTAWLWQIRGR